MNRIHALRHRAGRSLHRMRQVAAATRDAAGAYLASRGSQPYTFAITDIATHVAERSRELPELRQVGGGAYPEYLIRGIRFCWPEVLPTSDLPWLFNEVFAPVRLNPSSYDHAHVRLADSSWVLDAGAGEGFFTMWALERRAQRVVALEPLQILQGSLRATFSEEVATERVQLVRAALGVEDGETTIAFASDRPSEATVGTGNEIVPVRSLDSLAAQLGLGPRGFVKMDIEGAEMDALSGATELLRESKPALAVAVYHDFDNARTCREILLQANPAYQTAFRGLYTYFDPPRPYMLFAW